jgi:hypothetical protein
METSQIIFVMIVLGYGIVAAVRLVLNYRLAKQTKAYEAAINQKMMAMQTELATRADQLKDSIQLINHEYTKIMRDIQSDQRHKMHDIADQMDALRRSASPKGEQSPKGGQPDGTKDGTGPAATGPQ